jgi:hypothetical protein
VIDPTKNVLDLVRAESKYQDGMREAEAKYQDALREAEIRHGEAMARLKENYDNRIADMLSVQVKTTSDLISTQLDKVTTALGAQITTLTAATQAQFQALTQTLNDRIAQLERFRYEMGGRTSVSDPATANALIEMANAIRLLRTTDDKTEGRGLGRSEIYAIIIVVIAAGGLFLGLHK